MNKSEIPTLAEVHKEFCEIHGIEYDPKNMVKDLEWNCFAVSQVLSDLLVDKGIDSRAVYGMWHGNMRSGRKGPFRHGWVVVGEKIIDPTRWVFDGITPQMYQADGKNRQYDEGMVRFRAQFARPYPAFSKDQTRYTFEWSLEASAFLNSLTGKDCSVMSAGQVLWVANVSFHTFGSLIEEVYSEFVGKGCGSFIPVDFKNYWLANRPVQTS